MAVRFHQCVHCQGLVELFGEIVPCVHRGPHQLDIPRGELECDCPPIYTYIAPSDCSRATCDGYWSISDDPFLFHELCKRLDDLYDGRNE